MGLSADKRIEQVGKTGIEETEKWNWVLNVIAQFDTNVTYGEKSIYSSDDGNSGVGPLKNTVKFSPSTTIFDSVV